jgi:hypothetical protein
VKKLALAAMLLASTAAYAADEELPPEAPPPVPSIRVTPPPVPPLGWVYNYYAPCADPQCGTVVVNVDAAGLNVRTTPWFDSAQASPRLPPSLDASGEPSGHLGERGAAQRRSFS